MPTDEAILNALEFSHVIRNGGRGDEILKIRVYLHGLLIGEAAFLLNQAQGFLQASEIGVHVDYRRRGIGTAIYQKAEAITGLELRPGDYQSEEAIALWSHLRSNR